MEQKKLSQHENLLGTNNLVVRQNRFDSEGIFHAEFDGKKFKILNYSLFGLGILAEEKLVEGSTIDSVDIKCGNQVIASLSFSVKRVKKADFGFEVGLEVLNSTLPIETIMRIKDFNTVVLGLSEKQNYFNELPSEFKVLLLELSVRLETYEKYVKAFSEKEFDSSREFYESRESLIEVVSNQIRTDLLQTTEKLKASFGPADSQKFKAAFSFFRESIGRFLFQSPFTKRSYEKPRGYAGDFVMMTQIYANDAHSSTLFGSCMEKAVQSFGEPSAVRNRSGYLARKIQAKIKATSGKLRFLSVASGPAEEVRQLVLQLSQADLDRCEFSLLDQDEGALQFAQKSVFECAIANNKRVNLKLMNKGIKEVLMAGLGEGQYDMIYSAGLFDYFTDPVASKACKVLFNHITADGSLLIGNFNTVTTNWFGMLALFDWSLILRSQEDLIRLFKIEKSHISIESEDNNINLFCCLSK